MDIASDLDPLETASGATRSTRSWRSRAPSAHTSSWSRAHRRSAPPRRACAVLGQYGLHQYDPRPSRSRTSRRPGDRAPHPLADPLERGGDRAARQQGHPRTRRPYRQLPVGGDALRRRLQPLLARADRAPMAATWSTSRATPRRASTRAPSSRAGSTEEQLVNFRQEVDGKGISSYPHPWLMPDFWQFPTVSMGLGPLMAIYQARFMKYLQGRGLARHRGPQGLGVPAATARCDEPESLGAIGMAGRERLDNLIFVVNCNLQRLDGPVRGNGKIIQELEGDFRGAGWNVIKVIWGSGWDRAARPRQRRASCCKPHDGMRRRRIPGLQVEERRLCARAFLRQVSGTEGAGRRLTDEEIWRLNRGGHDPHKVYAAYAAAVKHKGQPTVILAKTVKGYGMGEAGEGAEHHPPAEEDGRCELARVPRPLRASRSPTSSSRTVPFIRFARGQRRRRNTCARAARRSAAMLPQRRAEVGRRCRCRRCRRSSACSRAPRGARSRPRWPSCGSCNTLLRDKTIGKHIVPIVPDESRTFGMEGMFRQLGICSQVGQLYKPEDADQLMFYKEDKHGPDPAGRHQRGRRDVVLDRGGDVVQHQQRADDPVLHLLLDVRLPARRRPGLGRRRHALARLPARRHRRAHHAQRRGPAARGRPQPRAGGHHPELRLATTRPSRYEVAVIMQDGLRRMYQRAGGRLLLPHPDERELRAPGDAGRRGGRASEGHVPAAGRRRRRARRRACSCWAAARSCAR